jgi:hypothetical protein
MTRTNPTADIRHRLGRRSIDPQMLFGRLRLNQTKPPASIPPANMGGQKKSRISQRNNQIETPFSEINQRTGTKTR